MTNKPSSRHRRSIRARCYDYSHPGMYFITICADGMQSLFGTIEDGQVQLSPAGQIVREHWQEIPKHFPAVELDAFVVMPNHFHGIVRICRGAACCPPAGPVVTVAHFLGQGAACCAPTEPVLGRVTPGSLGAIIRSFKSSTTKRVRETTGNSGLVVWQRNYFEHIVRNDDALERIREYIVGNPWNWATDGENPRSSGEDPFDAWVRSIPTSPRRGAACCAPAGPVVSVTHSPGQGAACCAPTHAARRVKPQHSK